VVRDLGEFAVQDLRPCAYRTEQTVHFARNRPERRNVHGSMILPPTRTAGVIVATAGGESSGVPRRECVCCAATRTRHSPNNSRAG
jgi:hypothetical protein